MKKLTLLSLLVAMSVSFISASDNQKAIEYYTYGLVEPAKKILLLNLQTKNMSAEAQAEAYYYLGESCFDEQKRDSAAYYYQQGLHVAPEYVFNSIGLAKLELKTNASNAEKSLTGIVSKNKKDMMVQYAVINAFLANNMVDKASKQIMEARKTNAKSAPIFTAEGDVLALKNDYGNATGLYEQSIYFDPKFKAAYIKCARIYANVNLKSAVGVLQNLFEIDPTSYLPYREMGDIYYQNRQYADAEKAYSKYIENEQYAINDNYPKYATILFFNGNYEKSMEIAEKGLQADPKNFVLQRLKMYNLYELKKYPEGLAYADKFINSNTGKDLITLDHLYYARLLAQNKQKENAIAQYQEVLNTDSTEVVANKEIADLYTSLGEYGKSIENYKKFLAKGGSAIKVSDYFSLGQVYYSSVTDTAAVGNISNDTIKKVEYLQEADSLFAYVAEKAQHSYLGNLWRARTNILLDPETEQGLAKPYYEAIIPLLDPQNNGNVAFLEEAYGHLAYYYFLQKDFATSRSYWEKIVEIDPTNERAIRNIEYLKEE